MTFVFSLVLVYVVAFASLVLHEFAHYIVAKFVGYKPKSVRLGAERFGRSYLTFGFNPCTGAVRIEGEEESTNKKARIKWAAIYISGPIMDVVSSFFFIMLSQMYFPPLATMFISAFVMVRIFSAIESAFYEGQDLNQFFRYICT